MQYIILIVTLINRIGELFRVGKLKRVQLNKKYHDAHCRKELARKSKHKRGKSNSVSIATYVESSPAYSSKTHILKAPKTLSICGDTNVALNYFAEVIDTIKKCGLRDTLYFDLSEVEEITADAIMYLIALINNMRRIRLLSIMCAGNVPKASAPKRVIELCGFFKYVSSRTYKRPESSNQYMKISSGNNANGKLASSFCDFVQKANNSTLAATKRLYPMIVELMTNTHQHAYKTEAEAIMMSNWYIFAQEMEDKIHFVFLDTGIGIPKTVAKNFWDRIRVLALTGEAMYLKSALEGAFRSETRKEYRGKGLPEIYSIARSHFIENLSIVSGKASCTVNGDLINASTLGKNFEGTLFSWDIPKLARRSAA